MKPTLFKWGQSERQHVSEEISQIYLELSSACNLACTTCVRNAIEDFEPRHFSRQLMETFVGQADNLSGLQRVVLLGFGEALYHPDFMWQKFIVTNLFPYVESMKDKILYKMDGKNGTDLGKLLKKERRSFTIRTGKNRADVLRRCPFIEQGTLFVTSEGRVAPCPELTYTHPAWYCGSPRLHKQYDLGDIQTASLSEIWNEKEFVTFREKFSCYEFLDCSICFEPDMCYHRTEQHQDCFSHETPCGECLWAKDIVICP